MLKASEALQISLDARYAKLDDELAFVEEAVRNAGLRGRRWCVYNTSDEMVCLVIEACRKLGYGISCVRSEITLKW